MAKYKTVAEYLDLDDNKRIKAGTTIDVKGKKEKHLLQAGVIKDPIPQKKKGGKS